VIPAALVVYRLENLVILSLLLTTALYASSPADHTDHRAVSVSRSAQARWHDSGAIKVWKGVPTHIRALSLCIRSHESIRAGHYKANNRSGASGAYQFMPSTWRGNALFTPGAKAYAHMRPSSAPPAVQDAVFIHSIQRGGIKAWHGTHCPGT
jgi:hypothetical protein